MLNADGSKTVTSFSNIISLQAVTHDRFKLLVAELDELIALGVDDIKPGVQTQLEEQYTKTIDAKLLEFLEHNRPLLTMYAEAT